MKQLTISVDTREQRPMHYYNGATLNGTLISYEPQALETFDYCVQGDWDAIGDGKGAQVAPRWAIERKSVADFIGAFFNAYNRRREAAKIARARASWPALPVVYVLEGGHNAIASYDYSRFPSGKVTPRVVISMISKLRYSGVHVIECESRRLAEYEIIALLKRRAEDIKRCAK